MLSVLLFVLQSIFYLTGGYVCGALATIIFAIGCLFGYGTWFMNQVDKRIAIPIGKYVLFDYRDWKFRFSNRKVLVTSFDNQYFTGICYLRQAERTFRRDRVQRGLIVEETGEVIDPTAYARPDLHKK